MFLVPVSLRNTECEHRLVWVRGTCRAFLAPPRLGYRGSPHHTKGLGVSEKICLPASMKCYGQAARVL